MTAPDPDRSPEDVPASPEALAAGQRTLAAIVFTDTVGFSKLMSKDEERTLRLVARDLDAMKTACGSFGGQVLKSTGDGLLMLFTSAVQAVACALEIQRDVQKKNLELPAEERLRHRIGIHLGDVFQHGGDVMGDGVNIAARLQTEAVPGGICLSQTVYDVVHNRLPFFVNDLGARKLKNIGRVKAYQISPMESAGSGFRIGWYRWRNWAWSAVGLLLLFGALGIVFYLGMHRQWALTHRGQPGAFTLLPPSTFPALKASTPFPVPGANVAKSPQASPAIVTPPSSTATGLQSATQEEFQDACFEYMTKYDFDGMESWMKEHDWPSKPTETLERTCPKLKHLFTWARQQMQKYSQAQPLKVPGKERASYYWVVPFGGVKVKTVPNEIPPGTPADKEIKVITISADQIQPLAMVGIIHTLLRDDTTPLDPMTVQLEQELHLFIQTYHIVLPNRPAGSPTNSAVNPAAPNP